MGQGYIEMVLGQAGVALLKFYSANSTWINLFVLLYGAWIVISWNNLKNIRKSLIQKLAKQMNGRPEFVKGKPNETILASLEIPWESAVREVRFPFVAHQSSLLPHWLNVDIVKSMLSVDDLTGEALTLCRQSSAPKEKQSI